MLLATKMLRDFRIARPVTPCNFACNLCRNKIARQVAKCNSAFSVASFYIFVKQYGIIDLYSSSLNKLYNLQKGAARAITGGTYDVRSAQILENLNF